MKETTFHEELKELMDQLAHFTYDITQTFPTEERYGLVSQMRRSSLSIILNYIEGYARQRKLSLKHFLEISYGSLKELKYLLHFSHKRKLIDKSDYDKSLIMTERIGKMLWGITTKLK